MEEEEKARNILQQIDDILETLKEQGLGHVNVTYENELKVFDTISQIMLNISRKAEEERNFVEQHCGSFNGDLNFINTIKDENRRSEYIQDMKHQMDNIINGSVLRKLYSDILGKSGDALLLMLNHKLLNPSQTIKEIPISIKVDRIVENIDTATDNEISILTNISSTPNGTICQFNCDRCNKNPDPLEFCLSDDGCSKCKGKRQAIKHFETSEAKREYIIKLNADKGLKNFKPNQTSAMIQVNPPSEIRNTILPSSPDSKVPIMLNTISSNIVLHDHYYWVVLTSSPEDGSESYIVSQLIRNFRKMMPPCTNPKASIFSIKYISDKSPKLYGLIRYNGLPVPYKMSPSTSIFSNIMRQETTHVQNTRPKKINRLTVYIRKHYETKIEDITNKWQKINAIDNAAGNELSVFL